jgi:rubrerythrin
MIHEQPTTQQLAHNDQVLADTNTRIDALIQVHRTVLADNDMHPQVALAGFAGYLEKHSDAPSLAQLLAVAIDRLAAADHHARLAAGTEWVCGGCGYHNNGGICTHCGRPAAGTEEG